MTKDEALELTAREFCQAANFSPDQWVLWLIFVERIWKRFETVSSRPAPYGEP